MTDVAGTDCKFCKDERQEDEKAAITSVIRMQGQEGSEECKFLWRLPVGQSPLPGAMAGDVVSCI